MPSTRLATPNEDTLVNLGVERLRALCRAIALDEQAPIRMFERLVAPWGDRSLADAPSWPSDVGDDHTPFEFSVALGASPELRVMVEPLGVIPSLRSNAEAALALLDRLAVDCDIDLARLYKVRDLFLPAQPKGTFALWIAAEFSKTDRPHFKVYLNPFAQGTDLAPALVEETMMRLGFPGTWPFIARVLARRGPDLDELMYLSLDLSRSRQSRVKVYARHRRCNVADLEAAARGAATHEAGDVTRFLRTVSPDRETFDGRAPFTCYAFVEDAGDLPAAVTTHFPINGYAPNDAIIRERVLEYLGQVGLPKDDYRSALTAFANRPLEEGIGIQSYVSIRRHHGKPRLTVYLPAEAYSPGTVAKAPQTTRPSGVRETVGRFEQATVDFDPFVRRVRREAVNVPLLRKLLLNHETAVADGLEHRAVQLAARLADPEGRPLAHPRAGRAYEVYASPGDDPVTALAPGAENDEAVLAPARRFASRVDALLAAPHPGEALGALLAAESFDRQVTAFVHEQLLRDGERTSSAVAETAARRRLAEARGRSSIEVMRRLPDEALDPAWRGARAFWRAARAFLADMYALTFVVTTEPRGDKP